MVQILSQLVTSDELKDSKNYAEDSSLIFVLTADIDLGGEIIMGSFYPNFKASFEGNCYTISNFTISNGGDTRNIKDSLDKLQNSVIKRYILKMSLSQISTFI